MESIRLALQDLSPDSATHPGLLLARYLRDQDDQGVSKKRLFEAVQKSASAVKAIYESAFKKRQKYLDNFSPVLRRTISTKNKMIVGLGHKGVIDAGLTLHHLYGVPVIPGSALKGLTAHYCSEVYGAKDPRFQGAHHEENKPAGEVYRILFGSSEDDADAGYIYFHDAWIMPESVAPTAEETCFVLDVMTPHHQNYYSGKGESSPTDFDSPVPVPFLAVKGKFDLTISSPAEDGEKWCELAANILVNALQEWGIGGKTSSGYGRMVAEKSVLSAPPPPPRQVEGMSFRPGDVIHRIECVEFNAKHKKSKFVTEEPDGSKNFVEFANGAERPTAQKGEIREIELRIIDIEFERKAYKVSLLEMRKADN